MKFSWPTCADVVAETHTVNFFQEMAVRSGHSRVTHGSCGLSNFTALSLPVQFMAGVFLLPVELVQSSTAWVASLLECRFFFVILSFTTRPPYTCTTRNQGRSRPLCPRSGPGLHPRTLSGCQVSRVRTIVPLSTSLLSRLGIKEQWAASMLR